MAGRTSISGRTIDSDVHSLATHKEFQLSYGNQPPYAPPPKRGGWGVVLIILFALIGGGAVLLCACCGGGVLIFNSAPTVRASANEPFKVSSVPPPLFPDRGAALPFEPGIELYRVSLGPTGGFPIIPGHGGNLWIYLPAGNHTPKSLPCVLITGAGTNLLHGLEWGDLRAEGGSPEHLPYVRAGFAVVTYELDGPWNEAGGNNELQRAYAAFRSAQAGLVNARNALEYVLGHVPEIDPSRIYSAGHSSAGTHALLFAEHEPRLAGCIAFAPCIDLTERMSPALIRTFSLVMPGVADFAVQSSPKTHEARLNCPVFLFHADDDTNVPCEDSRACSQRLKGLGKNVTLVTVRTGDHYESMIDEGIPAAIAWLKQR